MSNEWKVVYYHSDKFEKWFKKLGNEKFKLLYREIELLRLSGNEWELPHSRSLGNGLFELREKKFGLRIYYSFQQNKVILLLNGGDKTTQKVDIRKARQILAGIIMEKYYG